MAIKQRPRQTPPVLIAMIFINLIYWYHILCLEPHWIFWAVSLEKHLSILDSVNISPFRVADSIGQVTCVMDKIM